MMTMESKLKIAVRSCANYTQAGCIGCMMTSHAGSLLLRIDSDYENKPCIADSGKCQYFETIVNPQED